MLAIIISLLLSFSALGGEQTVEVRPQVKAFEQYWGKTTSSISLAKRVKVKGVIAPIAKCVHGKKEIYISESWWSGANEFQREVLIFHELAHCEWDLGHVTAKLPFSKCPFSVMDKNIMSTRCWKEKRDYYIIQLELMRRERAAYGIRRSR